MFEGCTFGLRDIISNFSLDVGLEITNGDLETSRVASVKGFKEMKLAVGDGVTHRRVGDVDVSGCAFVTLAKE